MGMFDEVDCQYPLPDGFVPAEGDHAQTKDTECLLDLYQIREDGTIWLQVYDIEDRSDPKATGIMRLAGCMTRVNQHWEPSTYHDGLQFRYYDRATKVSHVYDAHFDHGKLLKIEAVPTD